MCLAVPAKLVEFDGDQGMADMHGNLVPVQTLFAPEAKVGDWVLVHAGFVIKILDEHEAQTTWAVLSDLDESQAGSGIYPQTGVRDETY